MRKHSAGITFVFAVLLVIALPVTIVAASSNSETERVEVPVVNDWGANAPDVTVGDAQAAVAWISNTNAATVWLYGVRAQEIADAEAAALAAASAPRSSGAAVYRSGGGGWEALRQCEAGGNYAANTGNGFYGAYQFMQSTWNSVGGTGNPADASPEEQDLRAQILYEQSGSSPWPVCGAHL